MTPSLAQPHPVATRTRLRAADSGAVLGVGLTLAMCLSAVLLVQGESRTAAAIPVALTGAYATVRWPALVIGGALLLVAAQNPLTAHLGLSVGGLLDGVLVCLWLTAAWMLFRDRGRRPAWLWPGLVVLSLYPLLTLFAIPTAETMKLGFDSFRFSAWHLLAFFAVAVAPWPARVYPQVARAVVLVVALAAAYAVISKLGGHPQAEINVARASVIGLPFLQPVPFFGSFFTAQGLAAWMAITIPFTLAMALAWRGIWRLLAAAALAAGAFALLAADRRAAAVGAVAGALLVLLLFALAARAFGGRRLGIALVALGAVITIGAGAFAVTVATDPEAAERFEGLLTAPTEEETFQIRQTRWDVALESSEEHPFGVGLGEVGTVLRRQPTFDDDLIINLDSSYLKIAYEQGFLVLIVFAAGLVMLLSGLVLRSTRTVDPSRSAIGIGACGTLVAMMVLFYTSFFIESLEAVTGWILVGLGAAQFARARDPGTVAASGDATAQYP